MATGTSKDQLSVASEQAAMAGMSGRRGGVEIKTILSLAAFAIAWQLVASVTPEYVVPGWGSILDSLRGLRFSWVTVTAARVGVALVLSFLGGAAVALVMYFWRAVEDYLMPLVRLVMAVPVVCWILFAVLWFRGMELRIAFVLIIVCAPIFIVDLLDAMKGISKEWRDMVWSLRPTRWEFFRKLIVPAVAPAILTSWKVNLSLAIRVVTMAELVGATTGIGYGLVVAEELFSVADIFAWTIVLVVMLLITQQILSMIEARTLRWRE